MVEEESARAGRVIGGRVRVASVVVVFSCNLKNWNLAFVFQIQLCWKSHQTRRFCPQKSRGRSLTNLETKKNEYIHQ